MQKIQLDGTHYFLRFLSLQRIFATDETIKVWCLNVIFDIIEILNGNIWQVSSSALSELFEKVDVSGDGTISIEEYVSMCETYGIKVTRSFHLPLLSPSGDLGISLVSNNQWLLTIPPILPSVKIESDGFPMVLGQSHTHAPVYLKGSSTKNISIA